MALLERADLSAFIDSKKVLDTLDEKLFEQYQKTNADIQTGTNSFVSFTKQGSLRVDTPKLEEKEARSTSRIIP